MDGTYRVFAPERALGFSTSSGLGSWCLEDEQLFFLKVRSLRKSIDQISVFGQPDRQPFRALDDQPSVPDDLAIARS